MTLKQFVNLRVNTMVRCNTPSSGSCYTKGTMYKVLDTVTPTGSIRTIDNEGDINGFHYSNFDISPFLLKVSK